MTGVPDPPPGAKVANRDHYTPPDRHVEIFGQAIEQAGAVGNLIHDAHIAALRLEHGVSER